MQDKNLSPSYCYPEFSKTMESKTVSSQDRTDIKMSTMQTTLPMKKTIPSLKQPQFNTDSQTHLKPKSSTLIFDPLIEKDSGQNTRMDSNIPQIQNHLSSLSMDEVDFSSSLLNLDPMLSNTTISSYSPTTLPHDEEPSRRFDHMVTLGSKPKKGIGKHFHRRWKSSDQSSFKASNFKNKMGGMKHGSINKTYNLPNVPMGAGGTTNENGSNYLLSPKSPKPMSQSSQQSSPVNGRKFETPPQSPKFSKHISHSHNSLLNKSIDSVQAPFEDAFQIRLRTSEIEPSPHQVELPGVQEVLIYNRICNVMEDYREVDQNFDFSILAGLNRMSMESFVRSSEMSTHSLLMNDHRPIVKSIMECASDLVVEGFFYFGNQDEVDGRIEVAILRSDTLRQFITVWRGTTDGQIKPVRKRELKLIQGNVNALKEGMLPSFHHAYFAGDLETQLFPRLETLMEENPFFDLVTTGYSQGGALATIFASRYATLYPMMRVSCMVFGCPKIGGDKWRLHTHSLPNLKIIRVQLEDDTFGYAPTDHFFVHVGHTIMLTNGSGANKNSSPTSSPRPPRKKYEMKALAFKFDNLSHSKSAFFKIKTKKSEHHSLAAYRNAIMAFTDSRIPWVNEFVGEDVGAGVKGLKDEKRNMV